MALNNLGSIALDRGDVEQARRLFDRVLASSPGNVKARFNRGLVALREQDFERGWEAYELRFEVDPATTAVASSSRPRATGRDLSRGKRLAIRSEQGIGDQLLFSTLLPDVARSGAEPVVEVDRRLLETYRRSVPAIRFVSEPDLAALEQCDVELPIGSLARYFRPSRSSFSAQPRALLRADPARAREIASALPPMRRIAISWRTFQRRRREAVQASKSMPLEAFGVFDRLGVALVDIQYGDAASERASFDALHPNLRAQPRGLDVFDDLDGVMAAIEACDLVVTTSNVTAHLAGIIGKRTWLVYLRGIAPFHYWVPGSDGRSLWYPSVEVVTHDAWTAWDQALRAVVARWKAENA
jgi:hypothetical protein